MKALLKRIAVAVAVVICAAPALLAADNELTPKEKSDGWVLLFDGKTTNGWITSGKTLALKGPEDGALNPHRSGHYMLVHTQKWGDYVLKMDFKLSPKCNSGIFIRTSTLDTKPGRDVGYNGIEVAIDDTKTAGYVDTGAFYDLSKPTKNAMNSQGEWNHIVITAKGPILEVELNGEKVNRLNLDEWTDANKRPDGTGHKFGTVWKDHPRVGYIGLQDHGSPIWFKNIKIKPL
jgi:hypothetical protein